MQKKLFVVRGITAAVALCLSVSACVTTSGPGNGAQTASDGDCNEGIFALGGAIAGALLSGGSKDTLKNAAIGATLAGGACMAMNYQTKQTRSAQQVQGDYKIANKGALPEQAKIVRFQSALAPVAKIAPGGQTTLNTDIDVVAGTRDTKPPVIEMEMAMTRPDGKVQTSRKVVNDGQGAGGYHSSFALKMPKGVPEGEYPLKTTVYLNGQAAGSQNLSLQIVDGAAGKVALINPAQPKGVL
ncbi:MAG: hypothetical protein RIR18_772 [Pseudomonadota bacterium]